MTLRVSISEARARLPELAQRAMDAPGEPIIIEHRDRQERLVLTTESHLLMLEATVAELRKARAGGPFKLAGSLQSDLSDEQLEAVLLKQKEARKAANAARLRDLLEG
jgi:PHD/YefM family antitoxin component YafN of YafNO toxin-antitoxin module